MADERNSNDEKFFQYDEPSKRSESDFDREALEKVLKETLNQLPAETINQEGMEALRAVARRHPGKDLDLEPVVVELVQSVLQGRFGRIDKTPELCSRLTREVAEVLYEAPVSRSRLNHLWNLLTEAAK